MAKNIHTVYNSDRAMWENKREGNDTPLSSHHTKENALERGEKIAEQRNVEHFIHGKDGKIQERNSYGNDPFPARLNTMEAKLKHLEFIQSAVSRMGNNSFLLKGWGITIIGGLLALTFKEMSAQYVHVALAVLVFFWLLDSFYLSCERRFIRLYDHVRQHKGETDFSMHLKEFKRWYDWPRCAFSKTMILFYGGLAVVQLFVLNYYL